MSEKTKLQLIAVISGSAGFCIVGFMGSWLVAVGVFIMLFGNNLDQRAKDI